MPSGPEDMKYSGRDLFARNKLQGDTPGVKYIQTKKHLTLSNWLYPVSHFELGANSMLF